MRRISFALSEHAFLTNIKDVTRRLGWKSLKPGTRLLAVDKSMGLKPGERARIFGVIEVVSVQRERLNAITKAEVRREGYPDGTPQEFIEGFCFHMKCKPHDWVTRVWFKRILE